MMAKDSYDTAPDRATGIDDAPGGHYQFQIDVTDNGEPGSKAATTPDTYAIRVWNATTGDYYRSGKPTAHIAINGGNLQVKPEQLTIPESR